MKTCDTHSVQDGRCNAMVKRGMVIFEIQRGEVAANDFYLKRYRKVLLPTIHDRGSVVIQWHGDIYSDEHHNDWFAEEATLKVEPSPVLREGRSTYGRPALQRLSHLVALLYSA